MYQACLLITALAGTITMDTCGAAISHKHVHQREQKMQKFKPPGLTQMFLNVQSTKNDTFYIHRHYLNNTGVKMRQLFVSYGNRRENNDIVQFELRFSTRA